MGAGSFGSRAPERRRELGHARRTGSSCTAQAATQDLRRLQAQLGRRRRRASTSAPAASRRASYFKIFGVRRPRADAAGLPRRRRGGARRRPADQPADAGGARPVRPAVRHGAVPPRAEPGAEVAVQGFYNGADGWYRIRDAAAEPSGTVPVRPGLAQRRRVGERCTPPARTPTSRGAPTPATSRAATRATSCRAVRLRRTTATSSEFNTFAKFAWSTGAGAGSATPSCGGRASATRARSDLGSIDWTFFNPKAGARFDAGHGVSLYASVGRGGREPARSDMLQGEDNATVHVRPGGRPARAGGGRRVRRCTYARRRVQRRR